MVVLSGEADAAGAEHANRTADSIIEAHRIEGRRSALRERAMAREPFEQIRAVTRLAILDGGLGERLALVEAARPDGRPAGATLVRLPATLGWEIGEGEPSAVRLDRLVTRALQTARLAGIAEELTLFPEPEDGWSRGARLRSLVAATSWSAEDEAPAEEGGPEGPPIPETAIGLVLEVGELPFSDAADVATRIAEELRTLHAAEQRRHAEDAVAFFEAQLSGDPGPLERGFDVQRREAILRERLEHARSVLQRIEQGGGERIRILRHPEEMLSG